MTAGRCERSCATAEAVQREVCRGEGSSSRQRVEEAWSHERRGGDGRVRERAEAHLRRFAFAVQPSQGESVNRAAFVRQAPSLSLPLSAVSLAACPTWRSVCWCLSLHALTASSLHTSPPLILAAIANGEEHPQYLRSSSIITSPIQPGRRRRRDRFLAVAGGITGCCEILPVRSTALSVFSSPLLPRVGMSDVRCS